MMDSVYPSYDAISSPKVDIGKYFESYHKVLSEERLKQSHNNGDYSVASFMPSSLDKEELDMLAQYCSIDKLTVAGEVEKITQKLGSWSIKNAEIPKGTKLKTLEKLDEMYKTKSQHIIKSSRRHTGEIAIRYDKVESDGPTAIPGKDPVIYIRVYKPFQPQLASSKGRRIVLSSMIAILGTQTLDKVRDLIDCVSDLSIAKDVSENPQEPIGPAAKDVYKSGFFYIEGTFYNDFRDNDNEDNSRVIREWAESHKLGPFGTASMEDTRIDSLSVRFGYPWVYQHQGNCEHLIVFSDARLLDTDDELAESAYPRIHRLRQRQTRYCVMCTVEPVRWIITESDRIPHDPCYLCDICLKSYNYIDGKKLGNFKAYRYPHHPDLMEDLDWSDKSEEPSCSKGDSSKAKNRCDT